MKKTKGPAMLTLLVSNYEKHLAWMHLNIQFNLNQQKLHVRNRKFSYEIETFNDQFKAIRSNIDLKDRSDVQPNSTRRIVKTPPLRLARGIGNFDSEQFTKTSAPKINHKSIGLETNQ